MTTNRPAAHGRGGLGAMRIGDGYTHISVAEDWPARDDDPEEPCCYGSVLDGPSGCTCWVPIYDADQADPRPGEREDMRESMCSDCAYRPDSPERTGAEHVSGDAELLDAIVVVGRTFYCHDGMRAQTGWRHPDGRTRTDHRVAGRVEDIRDAYDPPCVAGRAFRADGSPALVCAGWAQRRRLRAIQE